MKIAFAVLGLCSVAFAYECEDFYACHLEEGYSTSSCPSGYIEATKYTISGTFTESECCCEPCGSTGSLSSNCIGDAYLVGGGPFCTCPSGKVPKYNDRSPCLNTLDGNCLCTEPYDGDNSLWVGDLCKDAPATKRPTTKRPTTKQPTTKRPTRQPPTQQPTIERNAPTSSSDSDATGEANSSPIKVEAFETSGCEGEPALTQTFEGGCDSFSIEGQWFYGKAGCDAWSSPYFDLCTDSSCSSCSAQNLAGDGMCGHGFGVFASMKGTCGAEANGAANSQPVAGLVMLTVAACTWAATASWM